jgi:hypothetical protein
MDKIVERIERKAGVPGLTSILAEQLSPTDLQSLLLEVYRLRSSRLQPAAVLSDYTSNRFVRPSSTSPISLLRWKQIAFSHLPQEFQPIALSPVCPLGINSVSFIRWKFRGRPTHSNRYLEFTRSPYTIRLKTI